MERVALYISGKTAGERLRAVFRLSFKDLNESEEEHRDRLFLQILLGLLLNILALLVVFYFFLPLSEAGREAGERLLWGVLGVTIGITGVFLKFSQRIFCVNMLLLGLGGILLSGSFFLGGLMSPTMIFLIAVPVLAVTLIGANWGYFWTAATICGWLFVLFLDASGVEFIRITRSSNVGLVQILSLLGTALVIGAVMRSYINANARLRRVMQEKTDRLDYLASHDSLTGIPNRRAFFEHAQDCLKRSGRSGNPFALVVIDLNNFKAINDQMGHQAGDAVLCQFASKLQQGFRETDFVGRLGGDEFGVLLEPVENAASVDQVIERFKASDMGQVDLDGKSLSYDCAVGVALYPERGSEILELYEAADKAMYGSKRRTPKEFLWK
jgi:diguanylate cyclase (GGDEF)-like protein